MLRIHVDNIVDVNRQFRSNNRSHKSMLQEIYDGQNETCK